MLEGDVRCDPASLVRRPGEDGRCDAVSRECDPWAQCSTRAAARGGGALLSFWRPEPAQRAKSRAHGGTEERPERTRHSFANLLGKPELAAVSGGRRSPDAGRWRRTR